MDALAFYLRIIEIYQRHPLGQSMYNLLPTESEERGVLAVGSFPDIAILPSCQDMKTFAL